MRRLLASALVVAACLQSAPAAAQEPGPELDRFYFRLAGGPRALARWTDCLVNRSPQEARALFDHEPGSPVFQQANEAVFGEQGGTCLFSTRSLSVSGVMAMGSIAEHLLRADKPARPHATTVSGTFAGGGTYQWVWQGLQPRGEQLLGPLAQCLVARHADQVEAVLAERPNANGERTAYNAMRAEIADCIPPGEQRVLQPQQLRAALAATYYRAARAANADGTAE